MRILVLSDSHGNVENMARCVELTQPNAILHLGDCQRDAEALHRLYPAIPLQGVPGNCDWGAVDGPEVLTEYGGVRILLMHGHTRNVKASTLSAIYAAREMGAQILLFGHTHRPLVDYDGSVGDESRHHWPRQSLHLRHHYHLGRQGGLLHLSNIREVAKCPAYSSRRCFCFC